jgi:hypothetical protein
MALFLLEIANQAHDREEVRPLLDQVARAVERDGGEFIEAQVPGDLGRVYVIVEHADEGALRVALDRGGVPPRGVARVQLVGASLEDVKAARDRSTTAGGAEYLVEWDFPAGLTLDDYLTRKKEKAPLYAQVPDVKFLRTYVCEDMSKCLCFYQAQDEDAVRRAREVVSTPITRLSRLSRLSRLAQGSGSPAGAGRG